MFNIVENLFTADCETVSVLNTRHPFWGDTGKHFFFEASGFTKMVGETDWNTKKYEVIQHGSKSWTGTIIVLDDTYGTYGMRDSGAAEGDWAQGDLIQLRSCVESGILLLQLKKCP